MGPTTNNEHDIFDATLHDEGELQLRPSSLYEFIGQSQIKESLSIFIQAAKKRNYPLDHTLFYGPPGLGKTTLAQIVAKEMGVNFRFSSGPMIVRPGDLASILSNLQYNDVFFIDEIHRLPISVEEVLYSAMEDFYIDIILGEGPSARSVRIDLPKFTLIGATTRLGVLSNPLRDRFGIPIKLEFYTEQELAKVIEQGAFKMGTGIDNNAIILLSKRARGTPRIALRLLRRARDFADIKSNGYISEKICNITLEMLEIDGLGLNRLDRTYLQYIYKNYNGGPVGLSTIAAGIAEGKDTIEDSIEPYLLQLGFISRTPKGRVITEGYKKFLMTTFIEV